MVLDALKAVEQTKTADFEVTPSGRFAAFVTKRALSEYENAGFAEVYRYDATTESLDCVSCNPSESAATGSGFYGRLRPQPHPGRPRLLQLQRRPGRCRIRTVARTSMSGSLRGRATASSGKPGLLRPLERLRQPDLLRDRPIRLEPARGERQRNRRLLLHPRSDDSTGRKRRPGQDLRRSRTRWLSLHRRPRCPARPPTSATAGDRRFRHRPTDRPPAGSGGNMRPKTRHKLPIGLRQEARQVRAKATARSHRHVTAEVRGESRIRLTSSAHRTRSAICARSSPVACAIARQSARASEPINRSKRSARPRRPAAIPTSKRASHCRTPASPRRRRT